MKYSKLIILAGIITLALAFYLMISNDEIDSFEERRSKAISDIDTILTQATLSGDYKCCIEPPCKMCFLGDWVFEDGKCDCDKFIAQGELDKVCPECRYGIEQGECESQAGACSIEI